MESVQRLCREDGRIEVTAPSSRHCIFSRASAGAKPDIGEGFVEACVGDRMLSSLQSNNGASSNPRFAFHSKIILVPLTLSNNSYAALATAAELARESEAGLVLLHVVHLNIVGEERGIPRTWLLNDLRHEAWLRLRQLADQICGRSSVKILVCKGRPAEVIVETATYLRADVIVIRSHGYRGWLKWFYRSTGLEVIKNAPCRIWQIPSGQA